MMIKARMKNTVGENKTTRKKKTGEKKQPIFEHKRVLRAYVCII